MGGLFTPLRRTPAESLLRIRPADALLAVQPPHAAWRPPQFQRSDLRRRPLLGRLVRRQALRIPADVEPPLHERVRLPVVPRTQDGGSIYGSAGPQSHQLHHGLPSAQRRHGQPQDFRLYAGLVQASVRSGGDAVADADFTGHGHPVRLRTRPPHAAAHDGRHLLADQRHLALRVMVVHRLLRPLEGPPLSRQTLLRAEFAVAS